MPIDMDNWMLSALSSRLVSVRVSLSYYQSIVDERHPAFIELDFQSSGKAAIGCGDDGLSLLWVAEEILPKDFGENGGQLVRDISEEAPWCNSVEQILFAITKVYDRSNLTWIGIGFHFDEAEFYIANVGDELSYFERLPDRQFIDADLILERRIMAGHPADLRGR